MTRVLALRIGDDHVALGDGPSARRFHHVWLRDNCGCSECRVAQTAERRHFTADIPDDISPRRAQLDAEGSLHVEWNDGHRSSFSAEWLSLHDYSGAAHRVSEIVLWGADHVVHRFDHEALFRDPETQLAYLDTVRSHGAAVVAGVPQMPGEVERFAEKLGHVREVAFERIHNVYHDPDGYNVAHTPIELKPHTDMPSYHWPPSIQLLHFLRNRARGGESVLVDGWHVLARLRDEDPTAFETLASVPVSFQLFSDDEDTHATAPMVQLGADGEVQIFRFSNQLALPLRTDFDTTAEFYRAYRRLGRLVDGPDAKVVFKARDGDLVTVHGHRVLHGRLPFEPGTGERHLQDVYMEFDDLMARRRVLRGLHRPLPAMPVAHA